MRWHSTAPPLLSSVSPSAVSIAGVNAGAAARPLRMICFDIASVPADMSLAPKVLCQLCRPTAHRSVHERQPSQPDDAVAARNGAEVKTAPLPAVEHGFRLWTTPVPRVRSSVTRSPPARSQSAEVPTDLTELHISPSPAAVGLGLGSPTAGSEQRGGKEKCTLPSPARPPAPSLPSEALCVRSL